MLLQNKSITTLFGIVSTAGRICVLICLLLLKVYKVCISPFLPKACRYYPTCSEYSVEALKKHGICRGLYLSAKRVLKCNPLFPGGYDPVPK